MKKLLIALVIAHLTVPAMAAIKCEHTPRGSCCWDTVRDGPFRPLGC